MSDKIKKPNVRIYTDGSYKPLKRSGGYSALLTTGLQWKVILFGYPNTTNNRMELMAMVKSLQQLNQSCNVTIYSDSQLCVNVVNKWLKNWKENNFQKRRKQGSIANLDLIQELAVEVAKHTVKAIWLKAHTKKTDEHSWGNRIVDYFAGRAADFQAEDRLVTAV